MNISNFPIIDDSALPPLPKIDELECAFGPPACMWDETQFIFGQEFMLGTPDFSAGSSLYIPTPPPPSPAFEMSDIVACPDYRNGHKHSRSRVVALTADACRLFDPSNEGLTLAEVQWLASYYGVWSRCFPHVKSPYRRLMRALREQKTGLVGQQPSILHSTETVRGNMWRLAPGQMHIYHGFFGSPMQALRTLPGTWREQLQEQEGARNVEVALQELCARSSPVLREPITNDLMFNFDDLDDNHMFKNI